MIRKAKAGATSKTRPISPSSNPSKPAPEQDTKNSLMLLQRNHAPAPTSLYSFHSMAPTIDERATGFFCTHYIVDMDMSPGTSAGYGIDDNLSNCMKAVGLAALASASHAPELKQEVSSFPVIPSDSGLRSEFQEIFRARKASPARAVIFQSTLLSDFVSWLMGFFPSVLLKSDSRFSFLSQESISSPLRAFIFVSGATYADFKISSGEQTVSICHSTNQFCFGVSCGCQERQYLASHHAAGDF